MALGGCQSCSPLAAYLPSLGLSVPILSTGSPSVSSPPGAGSLAPKGKERGMVKTVSLCVRQGVSQIKPVGRGQGPGAPGSSSSAGGSGGWVGVVMG